MTCIIWPHNNRKLLHPGSKNLVYRPGPGSADQDFACIAPGIFRQPWNLVLVCFSVVNQRTAAMRQFFDKKFSDVQQVAVDLQGAVGVMGQDLLCQELAKLHAFLVEGVDVPHEALEHDLVLEVGKERA